MRNSARSIPGIVAMINSIEGSIDPDYAQLGIEDLIIKPMNSTKLLYPYRITSPIRELRKQN